VVVSCTGDDPQPLHQVTIDPLTKLVPVTVTVTGFNVPATAPEGDRELTVGPLIVKFSEFEETWLTESLTAIIAVPGVVNRLAAMVAVIEEAELAVMVSGVVCPLKVQLAIGEVVAKLLPVRVMLKAAWPAEAEVWLKLVRIGVGEIVKETVPGACTDPLITPICTVPAVVNRLAGITAVICVALTKVVES
jgi:hypothetical protein